MWNIQTLPQGYYYENYYQKPLTQVLLSRFESLPKFFYVLPSTVF